VARDLCEVISVAELRAAGLTASIPRGKVAWQAPCTLQHGMRIRGQVEEIILAVGHSLLPVTDAHTCCGSAGTYSILQPVLSGILKANKLKALEAPRPDVIATANIGCLTHLESGTRTPVRHWIELLDTRMLNVQRTR
jgi:glycolate oxidase iron-sulfur subunit